MLTSRAGKQDEASYIGSESNNYMVGVQLNVPLYDDGLNRANEPYRVCRRLFI